MSDIKYQFLDDYGTQELVNILTEFGDVYFDDRIVTDLLSASQDSEHYPTALAVMKLIKAAIGPEFDTAQDAIDDRKEKLLALTAQYAKLELQNPKIHFVFGNLDEEVKEPSKYDFYFHCIDEENQVWTIAIYVPGKIHPWYEVGDMRPDLLNYWKKTNIVGLREAIFSVSNKVVPISDDKLQSMVKAAVDKYIPD